MADASTSASRFHRRVAALCAGWAVLGGVVLLAVVGVNVASVVAAALFGTGLPGDVELTEIGVAVAVFAFLPYCQVAGLNVSADIFTARARRVWLSLFALLGALAALGFGVILLWRMAFGMLDQRAYETSTAILQIPLWWGYAGCLGSLALLALAAAASAFDAARGIAGR